jgi:hypothetical protein
MYSSYSFSTSALDESEWSASRPGRALPPGKGLPVPIGQEAGWASEPVWTQRLEEKSSASVGDRTPVVQTDVDNNEIVFSVLVDIVRIIPVAVYAVIASNYFPLF